MKESDKESIIKQYNITEFAFNQIGKKIEAKCPISAHCDIAEAGGHCDWFRMKMEEILSMRQDELDIEVLK